MPAPFTEAFVDKLILLEKQTGASVSYRTMAPITISFYDGVTVQHAARQIADFIGLTGFTFIVGTAKQTENVGGHIELTNAGAAVFIEVDPDSMRFPEVVDATLCHEICHKWLQVHGIASPLEVDNEILTDIATVFLGLGKIMLNGCKVIKVRHESLPSEKRTVTETKSVGYLDRDQLAIVYRVLCGMRKLSVPEYMQGLNEDAVEAVAACDSLYEDYKYHRFHMPETTQGSIGSFQNQIRDLQLYMADIDKHFAYVKKSFCDTLDRFIKAGHEKLDQLRRKAAEIAEEKQDDPALRYLTAIKKDFELTRMKNELNSTAEGSRVFLKHARAMGRYLWRNADYFPAPSAEMFNLITCPRDGTRLKFPENSGDLIATCPVCKYRFAYNTQVISFNNPPASNRPSQVTFASRIRRLFGLRKIT